MSIVSDKGTHYFVIDKDWRGVERKRKVRRFLCVGGPLGGSYRSGTELVNEGHWQAYNAFNNAGTSPHSMLFIHDSLIHEED